MKQIILSIAIAVLFSSCSVKPKTELTAVENIKGLVYGDSVKNDNVIELTALSTAMVNETKLDLKIKGKVDEVCPRKNCWITMKLTNGEEMRITFKDSSLAVPQTLKGKEVILDGFAYSDTLSVDDQKHYAKDAGKAASEIAKITTPKIHILYEARGLVVL